MSIIRYCKFVFLCLFATSLTCIVDAQEPKLTNLLQKSPSPANSILYLNVPALSGLIPKDDLPGLLSDKLDEIWVVSYLDTVRLTPKWEAGISTTKSDVDANKLAEKFGGYVDSMFGKEAVWTPNQLYIVPMADRQIGFLRPTDRSLLSQWLGPNIPGNLPSYLVAQAAQPEQFLSFMLAVDLKDQFSEVVLADKISSFKSLKQSDPRDVASVLSSVQGVSVIVGRRSLTECILSVEFAKSPNALAGIAPELLDEILNNNGTSAPEVLQWKATIEGNKLSFKGPISLASLDGLLSIFTLGAEAEHVVKANSDESSPEKSALTNPYDTKNYFDKMSAVLKRVRERESQTTGQRAKWNDQQARKIDAMPTLNVDPAMIEYGANVASLLRNDALTIRTGNISAYQQKVQNGSYYSGGYGYSDANATASYNRVSDAQARAMGSTDFRQTMSQIDQMTADVRRTMTEKFKTQF